MKIKRLLGFGLAAAGFALAGSANATLIIEMTSGGGNPGEVVNFGESTDENVFSITSEGDPAVVFESDEGLVSSGGQCCLNAFDGDLNSLWFFLLDPTLGFGDVYFNLQGAGISDSDLVFITAEDQFGDLFQLNGGDGALLGSGGNWFRMYSNDNQVAVRISISAPNGVSMRDFQQVRLGSAELDGGPGECPDGQIGTPPDCEDPPVGVPEPGTLGLLGIGLLGLSLRRRRQI